MTEFYRCYLRGDDKAVALMRHVRGDERWAAARFWAPFTLIGAAR